MHNFTHVIAYIGLLSHVYLYFYIYNKYITQKHIDLYTEFTQFRTVHTFYNDYAALLLYKLLCVLLLH